MVKKAATPTGRNAARTKGPQTSADGDNKARIEVRVDSSIYDRLSKLAADAGITINQLMAGAAEWIVENGHAGRLKRAMRESKKPVKLCRAPRVVAFGREATYTGGEKFDEHAMEIVSVPEELSDAGAIYGHLNYGGVAESGD